MLDASDGAERSASVDAEAVQQLFPPRGSLSKRWRGARDLARRRREWAREFFVTHVAVSREVVEACEREMDLPPALMRLQPQDETHAKTLAELRGNWRAVKVFTRRLPGDPIDLAMETLEDIDQGTAALREQVAGARGPADDRAPDGGRWFPWAMTHPESGMDPAEAAQRDMRSGYMDQTIENVDHGVSDFRRAFRKARRLSTAAHLVPLATLAGVVALGESLLSLGWLGSLGVGIAAFLVVDLFFVPYLLEPFVDSYRRRVLNDVADQMDWLGLSAVAASLSRDFDRDSGPTPPDLPADLRPPTTS